MSILNAAVHKINEQNALALMIYVIPNYPDPDTYQEILAVLHEHPAVTIIETTFPVTSKFSKMANETIQAAHRQAAQFGQGATFLKNLQGFDKPSIAVLYRETFETVGYEQVLQAMQGKIDSFLFEWLISEREKYTYSFERYGIELVQCVAHKMPPEKMEYVLSLCIDEPIVYLVSAPMTGATMFPHEELEKCSEVIKQHRPKAKTFAGFGIRTAQDVRAVSSLRGLDGVIIGTAFIEAMKEGPGRAADFLDEIAPALVKNLP